MGNLLRFPHTPATVADVASMNVTTTDWGHRAQMLQRSGVHGPHLDECAFEHWGWNALYENTKGIETKPRASEITPLANGDRCGLEGGATSKQMTRSWPGITMPASDYNDGPWTDIRLK